MSSHEKIINYFLAFSLFYVSPLLAAWVKILCVGGVYREMGSV
jgi:hypothetical protein